MYPIDKTRAIYLKEFYIILKNGEPERKTRKVFSGSPQWDGFLKVLSISDLKFLSLIGVEKPRQTQNSMGAHKEKMENRDQEQIQSDLMQWR